MRRLSTPLASAVLVRGCLGLAFVACSSSECTSGNARSDGAAEASARTDTARSARMDVDGGVAEARVAHASLMEQVRRIEAGEHRDACEDKVRVARRAIAEAVDGMWPAIEARGASLADAAPYRRAKLGPTFVREGDARGRAAGPRGWATEERSWETLTSMRAPLAVGTDGGAIDEAWVTLARDARALLVFDLARVVAGSWHDATRSSLPPHSLTPNPGVEREGSVLTVLIDPGPFDGEKPRLARVIETAWTSKSLAVHVRWTTQAAEPRAHRFVLGRVAGEPSYVSDRLRQVHLNPDVRMLAIAHEIGHVLGFSDRYARTYDAARCAYVVDRDSRDIMSDPEAPVTSEEWTLLADAYRDAPASAHAPTKP